MDVSCFCGAAFQADGDLAACPDCGEPAAIPHVTDRVEQDMRLELALLLTPNEGDT